MSEVKVQIVGLNGGKIGEMELPWFFKIEPREDLIRKAFIHIQSGKFQPKGRHPYAGDKPGAEYFGTGLGLARIPRIRQPPLRGRGVVVAMTRGGRRPHVTPVEKKIHKKLNKKEKTLAFIHAIAATARRELIARRGHKIDDVPSIPLIVSDEVEDISKTRELAKLLEKLGLVEELKRCGRVKTIGGKAALRGRRRKLRKGPLIVYGLSGKIAYAARNILGVDVVSANKLTVTHLAPGGLMGRLTIWTLPAISVLEERLKGKVKVCLSVR